MGNSNPNSHHKGKKKKKTMSLHYKTLHKLYGFMVHAFCHMYNFFIWFLYMIMLLLFAFFWLCEWQPLLSLISYLLVELLEQLNFFREKTVELLNVSFKFQ